MNRNHPLYGIGAAGSAMAVLAAGSAVVVLRRTEEEPELDLAPPPPEEPKGFEPMVPPNDGEGIPRRLSIERSSPYYTNAGVHVGVILDGVLHDHCVEFSVVEGWVRVAKPGPDGKVTQYSVQRAEKKFGKVEVFWKSQPSRQVRRQLARL